MAATGRGKAGGDISRGDIPHGDTGLGSPLASPWRGGWGWAQQEDATGAPLPGAALGRGKITTPRALSLPAALP